MASLVGAAESAPLGVAAAPPEGGVCPRCGTPSDADQEYCLECGLRLPAGTGVLGGMRGFFRRAAPWSPGEWVWAALLGLLLAGVLTAILITTRAEGSNEPANVVVATDTSGLAAPTTAPATTIVPPEPTTPAPTTRAKPPPPKPRLVSWPQGQNGYTVVLFSLPQTGGRRPAFDRARGALRDGLPEVGVLDSSGYSSLHPGYYVVFSGIYSSSGEASRAVGAVQARGGAYASAYMRPISR
jgi:hypothetical protein